MSPRYLILVALLTAAPAQAQITQAPVLAPQSASPAAPAEDSGIPALEDLSATRERPLFSSTRRPVEVVEPEVQEPVTEARAFNMELVGVVSSADISVAILRNKDSKEETRVPKGEALGEWTIEEVAPGYVILNGGGKRIRLRLFDEGKSPNIQVRRVGGEGATEPEAAPSEEQAVDEEVEPSASPSARPANPVAKPAPPGRERRDRNRQRRPGRPNEPR